MGKVSDWLQIGANVGILVGLVFVGGQLRQEHQIASAELTSETLSAANEVALVGMGEDLAGAYSRLQTTPEELSATTEHCRLLKKSDLHRSAMR